MSLGGSFLVPAIRLPEDYGRLAEFVRMVTELRVAGFIVFGGDSELTPPFLARLREASERPLLVMADYERGAGMMVDGMPPLPPMMSIGASRSSEAAYMAGKITALSALAVGVNVVLAPVLDVLSRPDNPIIGTRAFSDDPAVVTRLGLAFIEGVQEEGVLACAKHFPGHGDTDLDSHTALPRVRADLPKLEARELAPFWAAAKAGVRMMMTAHVVYDGLDPELPATFSKAVVTDLLQGHWGYGGLTVTDALVMEGAKGDGDDPCVRSLAAGIDLLLYPEDPFAAAAAVEAAVADGRLDEEALVHRLGRLAIATGDQVHEAPEARDLSREYGFKIAEIARGGLTLGCDTDGLLARSRDRNASDRVVGVVVDDDERPERSGAFRSREQDFGEGMFHVTRHGTGTSGDLAGTLRQADLIVLGLFGDVRAAKERVGLQAPLTGFVLEVLREHAWKTLVLVFGTPVLATGLPVRNLVFAYGDDEPSRVAALDLVFEGGLLTGRPPLSVGKDFPPKTGRGTMEDR